MWLGVYRTPKEKCESIQAGWLVVAVRCGEVEEEETVLLHLRHNPTRELLSFVYNYRTFV